MRASRDMMRVFFPLMIVMAISMAFVPLCAMPACSPTMLGGGMSSDMGLGGSSITQAPCDMQLLNGSVPSLPASNGLGMLALAVLGALVVTAPRVRLVAQPIVEDTHDPPDDPLCGRLII